MHDLTPDELGWLVGLATARRQKREESLERMRRHPGQTPDAFDHARRQVEKALTWARSVEDHLIVLLGDLEPGKLRPRQHARYLDLRSAR